MPGHQYLLWGVLFAFLLTGVFAEARTTAFNWYAPASPNLSLSIDANHNPSPGDTVLITVAVTQDGNANNNSDVNATMTLPGGDVNSDLDFSFVSDGNYTYKYVFDLNGTYKLDVNAVDTSECGGCTPPDGNKTDYFYVGTYSMNIAFTNDSSFNPSDAGSIKVFVSDENSNPIKYATGTVSITYPNGTSFASTDLTELGGGYYYYNFTVPSTLGIYDVSVTINSGSNSDSNTSTFMVLQSGTTCGNETCDSGESCSTCSTDCGSCSPTTGGAGGGGGGGGGGRPKESAVITEWSFSKELLIGQPTQIKLKVENTGRTELDLIAQVTISQNRELEFVASEVISELKRGEKAEVLMVGEWTPRLGGTHLIEIKLFSADKKTTFDEVLDSFEIKGVMRYDLKVDCLKKLIKQGDEAQASIRLLNLGDYYKDVNFSWWIEDPRGKKLDGTVTPIALYAGESRTLVEKFLTEKTAVIGDYKFRAMVQYGVESASAECTFRVEETFTYYSAIVSDLKEQLGDLEKTLKEKKEKNYETMKAEEKLAALRILLKEIQSKINLRELEGIETRLIQLTNGVDKLEAQLEKMSKREFIQLPFALQLGGGVAGLFLIMLLSFILYKKKAKPSLERVLGLKAEEKEFDEIRKEVRKLKGEIK